MDHSDIPTVDEQVKIFLPDALQQAIESYRFYLKEHQESGSKAFADFHKNAKICLGHIELLLKVARNHNVGGAEVDKARIILEEIGQAALSDCESYIPVFDDE